MSSPLPSRLDGIRAKIERAKEHIADLEHRSDSFFETGDCSVSTEYDSNTGDQVYWFHCSSRIPLSVPVIVGEVLHNLRSALDHLVWQLVEAAGNVPTRDNSYPVLKDASASHDFFEKSKASPQPKIKGVAKDAVQLIKETHPYKGGNDDLWIVHELNNIDKHRLLITVATAHRHMALARDGERQSIWERPGILLPQDGTELFRWPRSIEQEGNQQLQFTFEIAFGEPKIIEGVTVHHRQAGAAAAKLFW